MKHIGCFLLLLSTLMCYSVQCGTWVPLNTALVCYSGKDDEPGTFRARHSGFAAAVKLIHKSGFIRCGGSLAKHNSHFGCHNYSVVLKHPFNVVVTNDQNQVKFPVSEATILQPNQAYWYSLDGVNSKSSEIVLQHSFAHPYFIYKNQMLRVWYGEDLMDTWESNNVGRVCVDVLAYFV